MTRVTDQAARQGVWRRWLESHLPAQDAAHLSGVVERDDGTLVVFTESAAWSARLRYAVAEIEGEIRRNHPEIARVTVRVMPKT